MRPEATTSLVESSNYLVRFASNKNELEQAQNLRYNVFNLELGEGLDSNLGTGLDADSYDKQCHHLLVFERRRMSVIGTYRVQTLDMANNGIGFYTATEFNLENLPQEILRESVEVGRACIHAEHRNGRVLYLLWKGLAKYLGIKSSRYLFGCCSLSTQNTQQAWSVMDYLEHHGNLHPEYRLQTTAEFQCPEIERPEDSWMKIKLPQLFRLYLELGAKVCSLPAIDTSFKTIDYLILLDTQKLDEQSRQLFFR